MAKIANRLILIAEDAEEALTSWDNDIREFNRDEGNQIEFTPHIAKTRDEALQILKCVRINCAVVDLRLPSNAEGSGEAEQAMGNEVLETLLLETGVPAIVYSGHPQEASEAVRNSHIRVVQKRGGGGMEVLKALADQEGLMRAMEVTRRTVEREAAALFNRSIWPRWKDDWRNIEDGKIVADIITRQVVAHVAETLSISPEFHHPEEFYFAPAIGERLQTGDLIAMGDEVYVVVTPRCNMAHAYPKNIMLGRCSAMGGAWTSLKGKFASKDKEVVKGATLELRNLATQGHSISSHFIPSCGKRGPWLVEFKNIVTVPSTEVTSLIEGRIASIAPQFVPNLIQRYAAYLGRIGQPDIDQDTLRNQICGG